MSYNTACRRLLSDGWRSAFELLMRSLREHPRTKERSTSAQLPTPAMLSSPWVGSVAPMGHLQTGSPASDSPRFLNVSYTDLKAFCGVESIRRVTEVSGGTNQTRSGGDRSGIGPTLCVCDRVLEVDRTSLFLRPVKERIKW